MVLESLKRLFKPRPDLDPYEQRVLEKEHAKIASQIDRVESRLDHVRCATCVNKEEPQANRLIAQKRALRKTLEEIEWKLGYEPERVKSKRA